MRRCLAIAVAVTGLAVAASGAVLVSGHSDPVPVAGHGATCADGLDNDRDGFADAADPNDCFTAQESGNGRPPDHDENSGPEQD